MTFDGIGARQYERLGVRVDGKNDMSVLTVAGQKGGSGKSTLVRNLAIHFALDGYKVGIVDADLIQQHSSEFFADRSKRSGQGGLDRARRYTGTDGEGVGPQFTGGARRPPSS